MISDSFTMRMDPNLRRRLKQAAGDHKPAVSEAYVVHELLDKHLPALRDSGVLRETQGHPPAKNAPNPKAVRYPPLRRRPKT